MVVVWKSPICLQIQIKTYPAFPREEKASLPHQTHILCTRLVRDPTHSPVRVRTRHKNFPDKSFSGPSSFLQTVGILTSWRFSVQKCLIRSFLTSSAAVHHVPSTPLPGRNRLPKRARKLPKHSPVHPNQKIRASHKKQQKMPPF